MSSGSAPVFILLLVLLLTAFFAFGPMLLPSERSPESAVAEELQVMRFKSLGNSVAHAAFVEDAVIMDDEANLAEVVTRVTRDETDLVFLHVTNVDNKILASSNAGLVGTVYDARQPVEGSLSMVERRSGILEGAFAIRVSDKNVGFLYLGAAPKPPAGVLSTSVNPVMIAVGVIVALLAGALAVISRRNTKAKLMYEMNAHQEEIFSPKIEALKNSQQEARTKLDEVKASLEKAQNEYRQFSEEYETKRREAANDPLVQSIENLKVSESKLAKHIEELKEEENQLNTEINLLSQKREEVLAALEADKKEERTLHEKLDLIKKKILHLETPGR